MIGLNDFIWVLFKVHIIQSCQISGNIITGSAVILNSANDAQDDKLFSHSLLMLQYRWYIRYISRLLSLLSTFLARSLTATVPRALSISSSHLCALGAGMHAACPWEEAASLSCCSWLSKWLFQYHNRIRPDCSDDPIYIDVCYLRDHIVSPRDNNLICRARSEAQ